MALRVRLQTVRLDDKSTATGSHAAGTEMERTHARTLARTDAWTHAHDLMQRRNTRHAVTRTHRSYCRRHEHAELVRAS